MDPDTDGGDPEGGTGGAETGRDGRDGDGRAYDLHSVVVSYEDRPDRCTIYPRRRQCSERTTEWLSADLDLFVDLADET